MNIVRAFSAYFLFIYIAATAWAHEGKHSILESCKSYCPNALSEHASHDCLRKLKEEKKLDDAFTKSECGHALEDHEASEKKIGSADKHRHKHIHRK